ncbi:MAG: hypothetical protein WBV69_22440 [Candidatus Sulfotelmatobacter sp.]
MATITFIQNENDAQMPRIPDSYTQVNGIYSGSQIAPQFLNAVDNVQFPPIELIRLEQSFVQRQDLRFLRMR